MIGNKIHKIGDEEASPSISGDPMRRVLPAVVLAGLALVLTGCAVIPLTREQYAKS
jgi:hypothetical protein